jgi:hypothetical protein
VAGGSSSKAVQDECELAALFGETC